MPGTEAQPTSAQETEGTIGNRRYICWIFVGFIGAVAAVVLSQLFGEIIHRALRPLSAPHVNPFLNARVAAVIFPALIWILAMHKKRLVWLWGLWWSLLALGVFVDAIIAARIQGGGGFDWATLTADAPWGSAFVASLIFVGLWASQMWVVYAAPRINGHAIDSEKYERRIWGLGADMAFMVPLLTMAFVMAWGIETPFHSPRWNGCGTVPNFEYFSSCERIEWGDNSRAQMAEDLIRTHLSPGIRSRDVRTVLGRPDGYQGDFLVYELLPKPTIAQSLVATARWGSPTPQLHLQFHPAHKDVVYLQDFRIVR